MGAYGPGLRGGDFLATWSSTTVKSPRRSAAAGQTPWCWDPWPPWPPDEIRGPVLELEKIDVDLILAPGMAGMW